MNQISAKGKFVRSYRSKKGVLMLVFAMTFASAADAEQYKKDQGDNYRTDEAGTPLAFIRADRSAGKNCNLIRVQKTGQWIVDTTNLDVQAQVAARYGGNLGQELARKAASSIDLGFGDAPVSAPAPAPATAETANLNNPEEETK